MQSGRPFMAAMVAPIAARNKAPIASYAGRDPLAGTGAYP